MRKIYFLFCLISLNLFAQTTDEVKVDLSNPYKTIYTHLHFLQPESYDEAKAARTIYGKSPEKSIEIALKIKQVLDGKGLKVNFKEVPLNAKYKDTVSDGEIKSQYVLFPDRIPEIYLGKVDGKWYYSEETNEKIFALYHNVFPVGTDFIKSIVPGFGHIELLGIELWQYLGVIIFVLIGVFLSWIINKIIFRFLKALESSFMRFSHNSLSKTLDKLSRPSALLIVFYLVEIYIPTLQFQIDINSFLIKGLEIGQIVLWIYVFLEIVSVIIEVFVSYTSRTESKLDDQLAPILSRLLKVLVVLLGVLKMLTVFGVNTTTVIAGASIGGLAVALASQDTVKNLIGTFMIFLDKPFQIGDWIEGGGVEGTVEEVGFRSTRIRAVDTSVYSIPNSKLSEIVINNKGLRQYRRYQTKLGIRYDTPPELIEAFVLGVRKIIEIHPETLTRSYNVEFTGFGDSSLEILVNTYFLSLEWGVEQSSKHKLHMAILNLAAELGVDFAFPSQTVMIEEFPEKKNMNMTYNIESSRIDDIIKSIDKKFK
ncbi:mechanosensitive ion channel protein MscS [Wenyingzhuangia fucanilytica]|uniref:Mechanosensitive ion channel protein MscS n=1 Tax=Wenyingzhuangia fucanilytica TaxID=1790137 RepID=A0A1B1Y9F7_9FLAO|nr:mechanosensitive ion channel family protein [Wenyingzhuangia fucanilytica]ANW97385.1 mechanosensitive ion channel protein MscS [Wenyingzhuangia fucanilytica]